jgi:prepilin-type N-terminal cleavage/methylation domain-containing protein/prepilin-type processing-associated H-X9-DG protein
MSQRQPKLNSTLAFELKLARYEASVSYYEDSKSGARSPLSRQIRKSLFSDAKGFTLIELLVVIAIIAVLAGLLFPAFGRMQVLTDRAKCASNLRQVGAAINAYVGEHDGYLPGPLWTWQNPWYKPDDYGGLGYHLAKYLKLNLIAGESQRADVLMCPAWQRGAPYSENDKFVQYVMNTHPGETCKGGCPDTPNPNNPKEGCIDPWGDALIRYKNDNPDDNPFAGDKPQPLASLPSKNNDGNSISASTIWAMQDYDKESSLSASCPTMPPVDKADVFPSVVEHPVHKDVRNALFFDFHVEAIKVPVQRR